MCSAHSPLILASASDPENALAAVEFRVDGELIASDASAPFEILWTPASAGTHTITAVAIDGIGRIGTSAPVSATVTIGPPPVRFSSPRDGGAFAPGAAIPLAASASSPAGIARVDFFADGAFVASDATAPYSASWTTAVEGPHQFAATAVALDQQTGDAATSILVLGLEGVMAGAGGGHWGWRVGHCCPK